MEQNNQNVQPPVQSAPPRQPYYYSAPPVVQEPPFPTGKRELVFGLLILLSSLLLSNFTIFGGFNLGFALSLLACMICSVGYLHAGGCRFTPYSATLLGICAVICVGFARSDDGFVKFVMVCFVLLTFNLALSLMSGQNRRSTAGISSLLDPFHSASMGFSQLSPAFRGLGKTFREGGPVVKKSGAVLIGLAVALPLLGILIPLLMSADAAFSGLLGLLPDFELSELVITVLFGAGLTCFLYARGTALRHKPKVAQKTGSGKTVSHLTINTVLGAVCLVYLVYLLSQLAYFVGGFSGILPEEFTAAEYARRGFFEMAWLCVINLSVMGLSVGLVAKQDGKAPLASRLLCLFMGLVTVFLVVTASAKMGLYISYYGLTRLRVLTEVIMVFLGIATAVVTLWLFLPKLPYMKVVLLVALSMGAITLWTDVDTVVAAYNVGAYQSGALDSVDVAYLGVLGDGTVGYIAQLTEAKDPEVAEQAKKLLKNRSSDIDDFRSWNFADWYAQQWFSQENEK